jgi:hypothetical protein
MEWNPILDPPLLKKVSIPKISYIHDRVFFHQSMLIGLQIDFREKK